MIDSDLNKMMSQTYLSQINTEMVKNTTENQYFATLLKTETPPCLALCAVLRLVVQAVLIISIKLGFLCQEVQTWLYMYQQYNEPKQTNKHVL